RQPAETGDNLEQEFESLSGSIGELVREARNIAARSRQTRDQTGADRVPRRREYDRDDRCRLLGSHDWGSRRRNNHINLAPHEFGCDLGSALGPTPRPANLDRHGATLAPAEFA